jgi:excisionase family DNA binding protein
VTESDKPARVLIVDDDPEMRELLERLLTGSGFSCEVAGSIGDARDRLEQVEPDVVLLDLRLSDGSGLMLARDLAGRRPRPAVVVVTREDDADVAAIALDAGAYGYVTKPFKDNEIAIAVQSAVRRRRVDRDNDRRRRALEERVVERTAAVHQAQDQLRLAQEDTMVRLARALDLRDPHTGAHGDRMGAYCALLGPGFGLDPEVLRAAAPLHDIGKVAVPDAVLHKPHALTPEERAVMQRHAEVGHQLLAGSGSELLDLAAEIAWTHHERYDGQGYPRGLHGDEIPIAGRIAAVADVFDALISDRVHRSAVTLEAALDVLRGDRGTHLDPAVVDSFIGNLDHVREIAATARDDDAIPTPVLSAPADAGEVMTLQDAASALGVSASTLRRWADDGRVEAVRTAGGHRRFPRQEVRRLAAERTPQSVVAPISPPGTPLPTLGDRLEAAGEDMAVLASESLYRSGAPGWFAGRDASPAIEAWIGQLAGSSRSGEHGKALEATAALLQRADLQGATLLERHGFLERFGEAAVRALVQVQAPREDIAGARRLFVALQQALLAGC